MAYKADFHVHSYYSDGTMSPVELVSYYNDLKYDMIAITDHDGVDGVHDAKVAGEALKLAVISGVEFSTEYEGHEVHLLGYYFDHENKQLIDKCAELRATRRERNERLLAKLSEMGYDISLEELESRSKTRYVGKMNIARLLVQKGYISDVSEAFAPEGIFEKPEIREIRRKKLPIEEAIELIKQAGGMAVVAHPGKIRGFGEKGSEQYWANMDSMLKDLKKAGLKGLECYHPSHSEEDALKFVVLAGKYHLHMTEGSDFHGK